MTAQFTHLCIKKQEYQCVLFNGFHLTLRDF